MQFTKRDLQRLILPLILEQVLAVTIGLANSVMVASSGQEAVAAVSNVEAINILLINVFAALATGGAVVCSQYLGKRDEAQASGAAKQLLYAIFAVALCLGGLGVALGRPLMNAVYGGAEPLVLRHARVYFLLSAMSYPFLGIYNGGAALFRSIGSAKTTLYTAVLMNVLNVAGNALFIFVFHMGVAGAALASLISRAVGAALIVALLRRPGWPIFIGDMFRYRPDWAMIRRILRVGVPNGVENSAFQLGKVLLQQLVTSFGTASIAANGVANTVAGMSVIPGSAIGLAMITVVGNCLGAGEARQARRYTWQLLGLSCAVMAVLNVCVIALIPSILRLYALPEETAAIAQWMMRYHAIACVLAWAPAFALPNALRAAGDVRFTMIVSSLAMICCRILLSFVLGKGLGMGVKGVWIAMTIDWVARTAAFVPRVLGTKWTQHRVI